MCFNTQEDFGSSSNGGVPVPSAKPSVQDSGGSVLSSIWNSTKGVFEGIASIELQKYAAERLADIRGVEESAKIEQQKVLAGTSTVTSGGSSMNTTAIIAVAALGVGVVLLTRR